MYAMIAHETLLHRQRVEQLALQAVVFWLEVGFVGIEHQYRLSFDPMTVDLGTWYFLLSAAHEFIGDEWFPQGGYRHLALNHIRLVVYTWHVLPGGLWVRRYRVIALGNCADQDFACYHNMRVLVVYRTPEVLMDGDPGVQATVGQDQLRLFDETMDEFEGWVWA
jgi:hypothetical protein